MQVKHIRSFAMVRNIAGALFVALPIYANVRHTAGTLVFRDVDIIQAMEIAFHQS